MNYGLAQVVQHKMATAEGLSTLVPLETSGTGTPVFIAHGLGGSALEFTALAKQIRSPHSIYGMRALGTDGGEVAFERIEDMAQSYLSAIENLQPHGPYLLVGYSLGGLVALEIAQRLSRLREKIALLVLIDAYPHPRFLTMSQRGRLIAQLATRHASVLRRLPFRSALRYLFEPAERLPHAAAVEGRDDLNSAKSAAYRTSDNAFLALRRYRPAFYRGTIKFVRAAVSTVFPRDAIEIWSALADKVEFEDAPGTHYTMLTTHVEALAHVLSGYLQAADQS